MGGCEWVWVYGLKRKEGWVNGCMHMYMYPVASSSGSPPCVHMQLLRVMTLEPFELTSHQFVEHMSTDCVMLWVQIPHEVTHFGGKSGFTL